MHIVNMYYIFNPLITKEMQINTAIIYHPIIIKTSSKDQRHCQEGLGEIPHSQLQFICKLSHLLWKIVRCSSKLKRALSYIQKSHCLACFQKKQKQYITSQNVNLSCYNSQEMAETNVSINRRMDKDNSAQRYQKILYNPKT